MRRDLGAGDCGEGQGEDEGQRDERLLRGALRPAAAAGGGPVWLVGLRGACGGLAVGGGEVVGFRVL